jgi:hypothetical protein
LRTVDLFCSKVMIFLNNNSVRTLIECGKWLDLVLPDTFWSVWHSMFENPANGPGFMRIPFNLSRKWEHLISRSLPLLIWALHSHLLDRPLNMSKREKYPLIDVSILLSTQGRDQDLDWIREKSMLCPFCPARPFIFRISGAQKGSFVLFELSKWNFSQWNESNRSVRDMKVRNNQDPGKSNATRNNRKTKSGRVKWDLPPKWVRIRVSALPGSYPAS